MDSNRNQLDELELRIQMLVRKYQQLRDDHEAKSIQCEELLRTSKEQGEKILQLKQDLSVAALATGSSAESREALEGLRDELSEMSVAIDECITLLEGRIE